MQTIVMHLDMNSYFASVEQQDYPQYRGKPLGVCEHLGGIIIAASIEAKRWGIKTGTPVWEAKRLYPKIILSHTHPDRYRFYHMEMVKVVSDYTDCVERYSIDEVFLDITKACNVRPLGFKGIGLSLVNPFEEAASIAKEIKRRMKKEVADYMTCSIGIAENKLLAKIASDLKKPDGIVTIRNSKFEYRNSKQILNSKSEILNLQKDDLYEHLKLTDVPGIGHRQEKNLNALGIKTLLQLKNYPLSHLVSRFGAINGYHLHKMGQLEGSWKPKVEQEESIKSIGHMYTLPQEFRKQEFFVPVLFKLCEMVAKRLRKQELMGNIIHFYFSDKDYQGFGQSLKLGFYVYDGREIFLQCMKILEKFKLEEINFKLIGITVAGLIPYIQQLSLFGHEERLGRLTKSLDKINSKYGDFTVCRVPLMAAKEAFKDSIGFGRLKEFYKYKRG